MEMMMEYGAAGKGSGYRTRTRVQAAVLGYLTLISSS
jgi:hypothetical protein